MHVNHDNQINDHYLKEELIDQGVILVNLLHYSTTKSFPRRHITYAIHGPLQCSYWRACAVLTSYKLFMIHEHFISILHCILYIKVCFIYILDISKSSSFPFWTCQFTSTSRCNWIGISTSNSNGSWNDKYSSHFSKQKR